MCTSFCPVVDVVALRKDSASPISEMTMITMEMTSSVKSDGGEHPCEGQDSEVVVAKINNARPKSRPINEMILSTIRFSN